VRGSHWDLPFRLITDSCGAVGKTFNNAVRIDQKEGGGSPRSRGAVPHRNGRPRKQKRVSQQTDKHDTLTEKMKYKGIDDGRCHPVRNGSFIEPGGATGERQPRRFLEKNRKGKKPGREVGE